MSFVNLLEVHFVYTFWGLLMTSDFGILDSFTTTTTDVSMITFLIIISLSKNLLEFIYVFYLDHNYLLCQKVLLILVDLVVSWSVYYKYHRHTNLTTSNFISTQNILDRKTKIGPLSISLSYQSTIC